MSICFPCIFAAFCLDGCLHSSLKRAVNTGLFRVGEMQSCAHTTSFPPFPPSSHFSLESSSVSIFEFRSDAFFSFSSVRCVLWSPGKKDSRDLKRDFSSRSLLGRNAFRNWILSLRNLLMWEIRSGVVKKKFNFAL